jgi:hypothetical protein
MTYIYLIENIDNNPYKVYIGKSKGKWRENRHKQKYGNNIIYTEIDYIESLNRKDWEPLETYWIQQFIQWGFDVTNIRKKGGSGPEFWTEEMKNNPERRKKLQKPKPKNFGEKISGPRGSMSKETKQKIKEIKTGKKQPNISKAHIGREILWADKISKSMKIFAPNRTHNPHAKKIIQMDLNENLIQEYLSASEAGRQIGKNGSSIADCASGRQKTAYGFIWKYK